MSSSIKPFRKNSMGERPTMESSHNATLLNPGPPALYQLNTDKIYIDGTDKKVRQWTYGRRDRNKENKVILMVGETGAGKTTLINTMTNYILGVKFEDQEFYQITEEDDETEETTTQTSEITVYEVFDEKHSTSLTIIDTPGFGNTEGYEKDKDIAEYLLRLFSAVDGIHYIDLVCFVMKATLWNRLSGKELYIFHSVQSLFGKDMENNIVFLLSNSDGGPPTDTLNAIKKAQIHCRKEVKKQPVHFLFNNQQKKRRDEQYNLQFKSTWEMADESLNEFFKLLEEKNRKSVQMTLDVLKDRRRLDTCVYNLKKRIAEEELKMKELNQIQEALRQNRDKVEKCQNFQFTVKTVVKEKVSTENEWWWKRNPTCCSICEENCHMRCWDDDPSGCEVMKKNHCTVCTGKCHHSEHVKEDKKYVVKTKTVIMTFDALKQEYERSGEKPKTTFDKTIYENIMKEHDTNIKESMNKTEMEEKLSSELEKNKEEKSILLNEAYMSIMSLSDISLKADSAFTLQYLDFLIHKLKEEGKEEWVKNLEELRKTGEEQKNKGALRYAKEITERFDRAVTAAASSTHPRRRKSMDEPLEKIAEVIRLKDAFIEVYERDHPHLQQCTEKLRQIIEKCEKRYESVTEGSRFAGSMGLGGFVATIAALAATSLSLGSFLFVVAVVFAVGGVVILVNALIFSGLCSSEKKCHMKQFRKDTEAQLKEFQDKINPMAEKMKELHEHTENILRGQDIIKMEDIAGLTNQISDTVRQTANITAVHTWFSLVLDMSSVSENNRLLDDLCNLAETAIHEDIDEEQIKSKVGKFIVEMRRLIHRLENVVTELEKTKEQLAVY